MNDLMKINNANLQEIMSNQDLQKYHFLSKFIKNYKKKKEAFIEERLSEIKGNFKKIYKAKIYASKNKSESLNQEFNNDKVLCYLHNISGIMSFKEMVGRVIPISFLISTLLILCYFYISSTTSSGVFLSFYVGSFLLSIFILSAFNNVFFNQIRYRRIFNSLINNDEIRAILGYEFDKTHYLNHEELKDLKMIITKNEFLSMLERKSVKLFYCDILDKIDEEYNEIINKIKYYNLNQIYENI